ncbi:MAG: TetR/AcrR family transcriptional regulator [Gammaproteobacteria bacterium]|jgi:AcrR family transcriptional regulator
MTSSVSSDQENTGQDTRERILDAAEALIIERGFAATSLRAIADRAKVNLAATNYHFGSKTGLLAAVFHRIVEPINAERLRRISTLERSVRSLTINEILAALCMPLVEASGNNNLLQVMGRIYSEPESVTKPIIESEFTETANRFIAALARELPDVELETLRWRFHFMIGSVIHLMRVQAPIGQQPSAERLQQGVQQLIEYSAAGLTAQGDQQHD